MNKKNATYATGRRKTAIARVWVAKGESSFTVNDRDVKEYFSRVSLLPDIYRPLELAGGKDQFCVWATVTGGGDVGQAGIVDHVSFVVMRRLGLSAPAARRRLARARGSLRTALGTGTKRSRLGTGT